MYIIGITGGVGAGKSTILDYLREQYDAYTVQADLTAHELMEPEGSCYEPVLNLLGREILDEQGKIDRKRTAGLVFPCPNLLKQLNQIVHPAVKREIRRRIAAQEAAGRDVFVIEAALLLEDHYDEICGDMWYIHVEEAVRRQRLKQQRGYSDEKITDILNNQLSDAVFREKCSYTVENNGDFQTACQQIDERIREYGFMQHCQRQQR